MLEEAAAGAGAGAYARDWALAAVDLSLRNNDDGRVGEKSTSVGSGGSSLATKYVSIILTAVEARDWSGGKAANRYKATSVKNLA